MIVREIHEGRGKDFEPGSMKPEQALALRDSKKVDIERNFADQHFKIRSNGWIGYLVASPDFALRIVPKVRIANVFRMLEYVNRMESVDFPKSLVDIKSIDDLSEGLASILANLVLNRAKKGLYANYVEEQGALPFVRGRIDVNSTLRAFQWPSATLSCEYEEHTVDVEDNRILLWTLYCLRNYAFKWEVFHRAVRRAYQALNGSITLEQKEPSDCIGRHYDRLNDDYRPMHMLCAFILQSLSPNIEEGRRTFLPFTLYMPQLFESFVLEWLKEHSPDNMLVEPWTEPVAATVPLTLKMDILLRDRRKPTDVKAVLDTKYKTEESDSSATKPSNKDISQIVTYAHQMNCSKGILVYPSNSSHHYKAQLRGISVETIEFDISQDDLGGQKFCDDLARALEE